MKPQFLHIFACMKYWLIAVSSMVSARLRASSMSGWPFTANLLLGIRCQDVLGTLSWRLKARGLRTEDRRQETKPHRCIRRGVTESI